MHRRGTCSKSGGRGLTFFMTRVAVLGDSRVGKTTFMHLATNRHVPLNIFPSREIETFYLRGTCSAAQFVVVPGDTDAPKTTDAVRGADALLVLYSQSVRSARKWILRCTHGQATTVPILVCAHNTELSQSPTTIQELLRDFPTAEHTETSSGFMIGIVDCANRIVTRARRELGSPL